MDFAALSADTAHRFRAVWEMLRVLRKDLSEEPSLLDVGGYPGTFARAIHEEWPRFKTTTLDRPKENLPHYISASGTRIPLEDETVDVVTSIDTLEHVPPTDRASFLGELCRVSREAVILAGPFQHNATAAAERFLNSAHERVFQTPHPWLAEHVQHGLPSLERTIKAIPDPFSVSDIRKSFDLSAWVSWQGMSLMRKLLGQTDKAWEVWDRTFATSPTPAVTSVPYRHVIIIRRAGTPLQLPENLMPPPESGRDAVELARLYAQLLEAAAGSTTESAEATTSQQIDQRLKDALVAAEHTIIQLRAQEEGIRESKLIPPALRKLFGRQ